MCSRTAIVFGAALLTRYASSNSTLPEEGFRSRWIDPTPLLTYIEYGLLLRSNSGLNASATRADPTAFTARHSVRRVLRSGSLYPVPALLTKASRLPLFTSKCRTTALIEASSVTSSYMAESIPCAPVFSISDIASLTLSSDRLVMMTWKSFAKWAMTFAMAYPTPEFAPSTVARGVRYHQMILKTRQL